MLLSGLNFGKQLCDALGLPLSNGICGIVITSRVKDVVKVKVEVDMTAFQEGEWASLLEALKRLRAETTIVADEPYHGAVCRD